MHLVPARPKSVDGATARFDITPRRPPPRRVGNIVLGNGTEENL